MKKSNLLFLLLAAALLLPLSSCGNNDDEPETGNVNIDEMYADYLGQILESSTMSPAIERRYKIKVFSDVNEGTRYAGARVMTAPAAVEGMKEMLPKRQSLLIFPVSSVKLQKNGIYEIAINGYFGFHRQGLSEADDIIFYCEVQFF